MALQQELGGLSVFVLEVFCLSNSRSQSVIRQTVQSFRSGNRNFCKNKKPKKAKQSKKKKKPLKALRVISSIRTLFFLLRPF